MFYQRTQKVEQIYDEQRGFSTDNPNIVIHNFRERNDPKIVENPIN